MEASSASWWEKLKQLRARARAHSIVLQSAEPEPLPLPKTIWEKTEEGKGSEALVILGVVKLGAFTALAVMGAAGLYAAIRNLRSRVHSVEDREALREIFCEELGRGACDKKAHG